MKLIWEQLNSLKHLAVLHDNQFGTISRQIVKEREGSPDFQASSAFPMCLSRNGRTWENFNFDGNKVHLQKFYNMLSTVLGAL